MKTLSRRCRLIALVPFAAVAILSIGSRIGAVADQTRQIREAADEVGFIIQGGITQGQVLRFDVARLASGHPGGVNLELKVFDSQGNLVGSNTYVFPPNQNNAPIQSSFFDLNAAQLPASAFDNTGRAQLNGIVQALPGSGPHVAPDNCGFVAAGEIFNFGDANRQTLVHIEGEPLSRCRRDD